MSGAHESGGEKPPTKFELRRAKTRSDLLGLGFERFRIRGYGRTTIEDIVRDSGYTRGAFYFHFDSKEQFFLEVLRHRKEIRGRWWEVLDSDAVTDLPSALITTSQEFDRTDPNGGVWTLLIAEFVNENSDKPEFVEPLRELYGEWLHELAILPRTLQERGWCRTDLPPEILAQQILSITDGFGLAYRLYDTDVSALFDAYVRILEPR
ncbi:TetR/AcrR family transcriptional regulator [Demequina sp. B12]|uniref:TetR/AcrR family transcriptional regulator n=1 Tax=Demequina sp. B12 TaxID=2992757 RepID=UPI00237B5DC9|nr:TetR/AcrR family transcriptional regulator [Demequina sp. B12]MDE0572279.1 TetR/AcrR family transcriptional regulator [Demequina sp. B12]